jgi:hypothetical protein
MRQTFSDLITICQNGAGKDTSTPSQTFFKQRINANDEFIVSKLPSYLNETVRTFSTVADQQYYHYPWEIREIEGLTITINSVIYPLIPIHSNRRWNEINAIQIQAGAIPLHYFKRQRDFGIWPIPQAVYTGTIEYTVRGGGMVREDYTQGTVTTVENDATVEGAGSPAWSITTNILADDWFSLTDSNGEPRGSWYRVGSITDADTLELESVFEEDGEAGATYVIGQTPEGPEEGHELRAYGALMDYFLSFRQSPTKAKVWANLFWTGDPGISRQIAVAERKPWTGGGLLGLINDYTNRDSSQLIERRTDRGDPRMKVWATTIS